MNRLMQKLSENKKALVCFVTAGNPDLETTAAILTEAEKFGADIVELGIPFSDPVANSPTETVAFEEALKNGVTLKKIFEMIGKVRSTITIPLVFSMYANSIYRYGIEEFFAKCEENGVDGVIIHDIPYEEKEEIDPFAQKHGIKIIGCVTNSTEKRIENVLSRAEGYLYCVPTENDTEFVEKIKKIKDIPLISIKEAETHEQAAVLLEIFDMVKIRKVLI